MEVQDGASARADGFVQSAATAAASVLVLPTYVMPTCCSPGFATTLGSATPGKVIKSIFCPFSPSQVSNEEVV